MASRHLARSIAMQSLFEWDFNGKDPKELAEVVDRNKQEFGPGLDEEYEFIERLVRGTVDNLDKIDTIIEKAAPAWPIAQITAVDRAVLRLGLYELLFGTREEVPPKVAINEAIELAKAFGGESSGKFVNGVLGTIYREIGEPGKEYPTREELEKQREDDKAKEEAEGGGKEKEKIADIDEGDEEAEEKQEVIEKNKTMKGKK
ncbi:MAG: transcription antitermination factor NusB [bacterium]|nr:transcription antitermination factor NusB [bacterium]MDZ4286166.1 transcription antitermination factor NusB [Candidatus Sungbacteria bacterium]